MSPPEVSVVIPSGRGARLAFTLEALAAQTLPLDRFEVIVVRDAAAAASVLPEAENVQVLQGTEAANIATLRNAGWQAASAPLIAFTDDDCRPAADWLERMVAAADGDGVMVQGRTEPDPDEAHLLHGLARSQEVTGPSPFHQTCNYLYPRALLEEHGGFNERFGSLGEDCDLALRAIEAGAERRYVDEAVVRHAVIPRSLPAAFREAVRRDSMPALVARHPQLREAVYRRYFWRRSHAFLPLAVVGLLAARRRPAMALLAVPYVRRTLDPRGTAGVRALARRAMHLPSKILLDATEIFVTTRSAVRERTPLF